jgi:hypothetical protein
MVPARNWLRSAAAAGSASVATFTETSPDATTATAATDVRRRRRPRRKKLMDISSSIKNYMKVSCALTVLGEPKFVQDCL